MFWIYRVFFLVLKLKKNHPVYACLSQKDGGNWYVRTANIPTVGVDQFFNLTLSLHTADEVIYRCRTNLLQIALGFH